MPIAVFGSLNHDQVTHTKRIPGPGETVLGESFQSSLGGKGFNEAVACAKLRSPTDRFGVDLFGAVGDDAVKDQFVEYLRKYDIGTRHLSTIKGVTTGTATIIVQDFDDEEGASSSNGENRIIITRGANAKFNPTPETLNDYFNSSNHPDYASSIDHPEIPSHVHSHATKPLNNEQMAKTQDINPHPPSGLHSHGSVSSFNKINSGANLKSVSNANSSTSLAYDGGAGAPPAVEDSGLVYKNGALIHSWSASGTNLNAMPQGSASSLHSHAHAARPPQKLDSSSASLSSISSTGSFINSHRVNDVMVSRITGSYRSPDDAIPSDLHSHASEAKLDTLTYPSPKPSALDLHNSAIQMASKVPVNTSASQTGLAHLRKPSAQNLTGQHRLTNVSFSLGGTSAHSSGISLTPSQSYLQMMNKNKKNSAAGSTSSTPVQDNMKYFAIFQNEIPNSLQIINHVATNFPNVTIFYNPSPLPNTARGYNEQLLSALHSSHYIIVNEHELTNLVKHFHPSPDREPLTTLKNVSNFEPNHEYSNTVKGYINLLTKFRTLLTKPALIVTLGEAGILYTAPGQFNYAYVPAEDVDADEIVDTTGAGDTFLGALATCLYRGETIESACKFGAKASAETIRKRGAAESMPEWRNVERRGWLL